jgi:hypothetical protein
MTTRYTSRVTIAVPQAMISDANQLAACMGLSLADLQTFGAASYQDEQGNLYAVCSAAMTPRVLQEVSAGQLVRPEFDPNRQINMTGAGRALALLVIDVVPAAPDKIVAIIDMDPSGAIAAMGLTTAPSADI